MTTEQIKKIQEEYQRQGNHSVVQGIFDLSAVQEYAINVFGRDKEVPAEVLAARFDQLKDGMSIGDVAIALGYPAEASIS